MMFAGSYFHKVSSEMQVGAELSKAMNKSDVARPWLRVQA